jgi:hypothetical protein
MGVLLFGLKENPTAQQLAAPIAKRSVRPSEEEVQQTGRAAHDFLFDPTSWDPMRVGVAEERIRWVDLTLSCPSSAHFAAR